MESRKVKLNCDLCNSEFAKSLSRFKNNKTKLKFCSRICKEKATTLAHIDDRFSGLIQIAKIAYRQRGLASGDGTCKVCGYNKVKKMLDVHHIDGDRSNNDKSNLMVLCVWCHAIETRKVEWHEWK